MTAATVLEILLEWARTVPAVAEALGKLVSGHEDAKKLRDVLPVQSASERVAAELKGSP